MKLFKLSPLTQRRLKSFNKQPRAKVGIFVLAFLLFFSMTAELWSNQLPLFFSRDGKWYFPILMNYSVKEFGITDSFIVDYREIIKSDNAEGRSTYAYFPLNEWDPYIQTSDVLAGPSSQHWFGTDNLGRDVFARLIYGVRVSLMYGLLYWFFSFIIGVLIGSIQGYFVGTLDFATERVKELAEIIPFLSIAILVNGLIHSSSPWVTLLILVVFGWISIASQMRVQFLSLRKREFCEAAVSLGANHRRIIFKHILPNALTPIITLTPFAISVGISSLAVLDFLGFGLSPPTPSLGELLSQGRVNIINAPWLLIAPTGALCLMLISINLIGEALRQAFDPRK